MFAIPGFGRERQELKEFVVTLDYIAWRKILVQPTYTDLLVFFFLSS